MLSSASSATLAELEASSPHRYSPLAPNDDAPGSTPSTTCEDDMKDETDDDWLGNTFSARDHPVQVEAFHRNVWRCKVVVGCSMLAAISLNSVGLIHASRNEGWGIGLWWKWRMGATIVPCIVLLLLAFSTLSSRHIGLKSPSRRFRISQYYLSTFLFMLASIGIIVMSIQTYQAVNIFDYLRDRSEHASLDYALPFVYGAKLLIALTFWFSAGMMRRGPRLWYHAPAMELGFGVPASENPDQRSTEDILNDPSGEPEPNVMDDGGCGCLSFIFIGYLSPLLSIVRKGRHLTESDMPYQPQANRAFAVLGNAPNGRWKTYHARLGLGRSGSQAHSKIDHMQNVPYTRWTLIRTCWDGLWLGILFSMVLEMLNKFLQLLPAIVMFEFILQFETGAIEENQQYALLLAMLYAGSSVAEALLRTYNAIRENYQQHQIVRLRIDVLLFDKLLMMPDQALTLKPVRSDEGNIGSASSQAQKEILRLVGTDTGEIASLSAHVFYPFTNDLVTLTVGITFMFRLFGWATLGMIVVLLTYPLSAWILKYTYKRDREYSAAQDSRIKAIRSALGILKALKLNGWEKRISERLAVLRAAESRARYRADIGGLALSSLLALFSESTVILVLATYILGPEKPILQASSAFTILAMFGQVRSALESTPYRIDRLLRSSIAIDRLTHFLNTPLVPFRRLAGADIALSRTTIGFPYDTRSHFSDNPFLIRDVSVNIPTGTLAVISGPTASGKSLFLSALLGEAEVSSASSATSLREHQSRKPQDRSNCVSTPGEAWDANRMTPRLVAYAPQRPYIFHSTVKGNILNGCPYSKSRFIDALTVCNLDLGDFPDQEFTEIGEGGLNISIGQAARISLARAIYSQAQTLLLDDPLASVDTETGKAILQNLTGPLLQGRSVIISSVQNDIWHKSAHQIIHIEAGRAVTSETRRLDTLTGQPGIDRYERVSSPDPVQVPLICFSPLARRLIQAESRQLGQAKSNYLWQLLESAGGMQYYATLLAIFVLNRISTLWQQDWMRKWTSGQDIYEDGPKSQTFYLGVYAAAIPMLAAADTLRQWIVLRRFVQDVPATVHAKLVRGIFGTTLKSQERLPIGRIMNRFIEDMNSITYDLPRRLQLVFKTCISVALTLCVLLWSTPSFIFVLLALVPLLRSAFVVLASLRADTRRISIVAGSPVMTLYNDVLGAVAVIRAYGTQSLYTSALMTHQTAYRRLGVMEYMVFNYFRTIFALASSVCFSSIAIFLVFKPDLSAGQVGLTLSFATMGSSFFIELLNEMVELGGSLVALERISEYQDLEPEEDADKVKIEPASDWPSSGHIEVQNLNVRYADDLPDVLHDISFEVRPGERIGIVGHTGHGKSTLALSLFRAVQARSGSISMDGIDIESVSLDALRSGLSMIPQEGLLNGGTLRDALDITGDLPDAELYDALRRVQLIPPSSAPETSCPGNIPTGSTSPYPNRFHCLSTPVAPGGSNFSAGERQLICLARALLKTRGVMVFDEATSSVDPEADRKIKETIKNSFQGSTMLVIAHRLGTIIDFDRIMVIERGELVEFDTPARLLANKDGAFRALAQASGEEEVLALL